MTNKTAVIYARVSTVRQAEDELPIQSQIDNCSGKSAELDCRVLKIFRDEGKSGRHDSRPAFQSAISYCESFHPDFFITWSSSRFARNVEDAIVYKRRLSRLNVQLIYCTMDIDTDTIGGFALDHVMSLFDDIYSRQISDDTKRSMIKNAQDGFYNGGNVPFGFDVVATEENPKRKRLCENIFESDVVNKIFNLKNSGDGLRTIAQHFNDDGVLNRGRRWNKSSVSGVLRSRAVIGQIVFNKKNRRTGAVNPREKWIITNAHAPIIKMDLWDRTQKQMDAQTFETSCGSPQSMWMFTGLLKCGLCGASMQIETAKGRSRRYQYYNCRTAQRSGECRNRRISAPEFDAWLASEIAKRIFTRRNLRRAIMDLRKHCSQWAKKQTEKKRRLFTKLSSMQTKNEKIFELIEAMGKETPNISGITNRLQGNNKEIHRIERKLSQIENDVPPAVDVEDHDVQKISDFLVSAIKTSNNAQKKRQFFSGFINKIKILDEEVAFEYSPQMIIKSTSVPSARDWLPAPDALGTEVVRFLLPDKFCKRVA